MATTQLENANLKEWAGHFREDVENLQAGSEVLASTEPPLPSIADIAGSVDFGPSEEDELDMLRVENQRQAEQIAARDAAIRLALQYLTGGGQAYINSRTDAQAAIDVLLAADAPSSETDPKVCGWCGMELLFGPHDHTRVADAPATEVQG